MPKRYVIIGAGAIGGSVGGRLHQAGRDVVLVARGPHLDALRRDGLRRGDRVAVYLDKRLETVAAIFGTSCGSGVFVPVNPVLRAAQVGHILRDAGCRVLVTTTERYASLKAELSTCDSVEVVVLVGTDEAPATDAAYRIRTWSELVADSDWPPQGPAEPAIDVDASSTRREELLIGKEELSIIWKLRRVLSNLDGQQALEMMLDRLRKTQTNGEFLVAITKSMPSRD